jgi:hypothetical protein
MYFKSRSETFRASAVTVHLLNALLLEIHYVFIMCGISNTMGHFFSWQIKWNFGCSSRWQESQVILLSKAKTWYIIIKPIKNQSERALILSYPMTFCTVESNV